MEREVREGLYLVGTAHVSRDSVDEVRSVIEGRRPALVGVELCRPRFDALVEQNRWESTSIIDVLRSGKGFLLLAQIMLSMTQRRLGSDLGVEPGAEMLAAVDAARRTGADVVLLDRDINVTFRRAWSGMGLREKLRLSWHGMRALTGWYDAGDEPELETEDDIRKLMEEDTLTAMLEEVREIAPSATEVLLDERDESLALRTGMAVKAKAGPGWVRLGGEKERWLPSGELPDVKGRLAEMTGGSGSGETGEVKGKAGGKGGRVTGGGKKEKDPDAGALDEAGGRKRGMVVVVGAGHVKGMARRLKRPAGAGTPRRLKELDTVPENRWPWHRVFGYAFTAALVIGAAWLAYTGDWDRLFTLALWWVLANGLCSAAGVAIARGHPYSIISAFFAAPVTSLNPSVGAGWVAGLVEAKVRTPTVADMKEIGLMESWDQFFSNRAVRVLMVAALGNLGSTIGTILFVALLPRLMDMPLL